MTVRPVTLDAGDAVELGELVGFVVGWLGRDGVRLASCFAAFVGGGAYDINSLRDDLSRFAFLVGGDDVEMLFGGGGEG